MIKLITQDIFHPEMQPIPIKKMNQTNSIINQLWILYICGRVNAMISLIRHWGIKEKK